MQFYSIAHFYPDERIVWMSEGTRYQSTVEEWSELINAPKENEDDLDVYTKKKKRLLHKHLKLKSLWEMLSGQGLLHQSPKKLARQLMHPRGIQGTFLLERRTRLLCLKLLLKKKMMRNMSCES